MRRDARFWRNVAIMGLAHIVVLLGLIRWHRETKKPATNDIVWMEGGFGGAEAVPMQNLPTATIAPNEPPPTPQPAVEITPEPARREEAEVEPSIAPVKSDIQLPPSAPVPTATPTETPSPKPSALPKSTPKPSPKVTPTPKRKAIAQASPRPTARSKESDVKTEARKKKNSKVVPVKKEASDAVSEKPARKTSTAQTPGKAGGAGAGGRGSGAGGASEFGWYGNMLHDRFYSEWAQPMTVVASGAKLSALVKLRIERDGRVSAFTVVKPSGNVVVDESVAAVAKRVTQVDPLPAGLGGDYYEVKINFELNPER